MSSAVDQFLSLDASESNFKSTLNPKPSQVQQAEDTRCAVPKSWLQCCGLQGRDGKRSEALLIRTRQPEPPSIIAMKKALSDLGESEQEEICSSDASTVDSEQGKPHSGTPSGLIEKLGKVMQQNPNVGREVAGRSLGSLCVWFLRECLAGNNYQCDRIWSCLHEKDRADLMQILHIGNVTPEDYLLITMEPDHQKWKEGLNEYHISCSSSDLDASSDLSDEESDASSSCEGVAARAHWQLVRVQVPQKWGSTSV